MKYLFIAIIFFTQICYAQESATSFWNNRCEYKTDGTGKSLGLKIKLSYPCLWTRVDGDRPHVVQKFSYGFEGGKSISQGFTITQMPSVASKNEIAEMLTQQGLKELASATGTFVSGRKLKIDGIDCGEVIIKLKRELPVATLYVNFIQYYIILKDKLINLSFAVGSKSESETKILFSDYKTLFQGLATSTVILSKWE